MHIQKTLLSLAATGVAAGLIATAVVRADDAPSTANVIGGVDRAQAAPASADLGVLRQPRRAGDEIPSALAAQPTLSDGIADLASARRVQVSATRSIWVAPAAGDRVCAVTSGYVLGCPSADELASRGASPSLAWHDGQVLIAGLADDSVKSVTIRFLNGSTQNIPVTDNSFAVDGTVPPLDISWIGPGGQVKHQAYDADRMRRIIKPTQ